MSSQNKLRSFKITEIHKQPYHAHGCIYNLWVAKKWAQAHNLFSHVFSWQHFSSSVSPTETVNPICPKVNALLRSAFHSAQHLSCPSRCPAAAEKPGKGIWRIAKLWGWRQGQRRQSAEHSLAYMLPFGTKLYSPGWESMYFMKIIALTKPALSFSLSSHTFLQSKSFREWVWNTTRSQGGQHIPPLHVSSQSCREDCCLFSTSFTPN